MINTLFNIVLFPLSRKEDSKEASIRILSRLENKIITDNDILREEGGRPYLKNSHADYNISHSGSILAVSFVQREGFRTGCDIQLVKERINSIRIAKDYFSPIEQEYISHDKNRFFVIWVLKECYLKLHGLSVFDMANAPCFIDKTGCLNLNIDDISFHLFELSDSINNSRYMLAAALKGFEHLSVSPNLCTEDLPGTITLKKQMPNKALPIQ